MSRLFRKGRPMPSLWMEVTSTQQEKTLVWSPPLLRATQVKTLYTTALTRFITHE